MKEFKIRVKNEEHSEDIQNHLFSKGVYWLDGSDEVKNTYSDFLYVKNKMGRLSLYTADEGEEYFNSFEGDEMYFYNGELQEEPAIIVDWSEAPEWANYAAKDKDGIICFYEFEPYIIFRSDCAWTISGGGYSIYRYSTTGSTGWEYSLEERPEGTHNEEQIETTKDLKESNTKELTIYKYPFPTCNQSSVAKVQIPKGEVIRIDEDEGFPFIWLLVDKNDLVNVEHTFYLHKTGSTIKGFDSIESAYSKFVGTISLWAEMELMFYIFHGGYSNE